jgi:hypothetical protein
MNRLQSYQNNRLDSNGYVNKYQEIEMQYKAAIIDKYLELKMTQSLTNVEASKEIGISVEKINQYKKDLGYKTNRRKITYTLEQKMEMSTKIKIAHQYRKEFKEQMEKADSMKNTISADEYNQLVTNIKDKYSSFINTNRTNKNETNLTDEGNNVSKGKSRRKNNIIHGGGLNESYHLPSTIKQITESNLQESSGISIPSTSNNVEKYEAMLNNVHS